MRVGRRLEVLTTREDDALLALRIRLALHVPTIVYSVEPTIGVFPQTLRGDPADRPRTPPRGPINWPNGPLRPHHPRRDRGGPDRLRPVRRGDDPTLERRRPGRQQVPRLPQRAARLHRRAGADGGPDRAGH